MSDEYLFLHVRRCQTCGVDTPHAETDTGDRCLACGHSVKKETPDAPA